MTALDTHLAQIRTAQNLERLSDIARSAEAMMDVEHAPEADKLTLQEALRVKVEQLRDLLSAG
jgi:hypothetical protein